MVFCIVPPELARKLHEPLKRFFREDPRVEVVVERRRSERRRSGDRRVVLDAPRAHEQRVIRNRAGRRVGDNRASLEMVDPPALPRKALPYADRLRFVERLEPSDLYAEDLDTARVVTAFQAGDEEAFGVLYMRYFDRVFSYLRVAFNDPPAAEDSTQQVFMKVLKALPRYERRPGSTFRAWLFTIVRNEAMKELAKRSRSEPTDPVRLNERRAREPQPAELSALDWVSDRDLVIFVERLPLPQRQVLMLRFMLDLPVSEIAEILDRTPESVRILQHRALRFLEQRLRALGRYPSHGERAPMGRFRKQCGVLRSRRFVLSG